MQRLRISSKSPKRRGEGLSEGTSGKGAQLAAQCGAERVKEVKQWSSCRRYHNPSVGNHGFATTNIDYDMKIRRAHPHQHFEHRIV